MFPKITLRLNTGRSNLLNQQKYLANYRVVLSLVASYEAESTVQTFVIQQLGFKIYLKSGMLGIPDIEIFRSYPVQISTGLLKS
jgi:hypothetical protein